MARPSNADLVKQIEVYAEQFAVYAKVRSKPQRPSQQSLPCRACHANEAGSLHACVRHAASMHDSQLIPSLHVEA